MKIIKIIEKNIGYQVGKALREYIITAGLTPGVLHQIITIIQNHPDKAKDFLEGLLEIRDGESTS